MQNKSLRQTKLNFISSSSLEKEETTLKRKLDDTDDQGPQKKMSGERRGKSSQARDPKDEQRTVTKSYADVTAKGSASHSSPRGKSSPMYSGSAGYSNQGGVDATAKPKANPGIGRGRGSPMTALGNIRPSMKNSHQDDSDEDHQKSEYFGKGAHSTKDESIMSSSGDDSDGEDKESDVGREERHITNNEDSDVDDGNAPVKKNIESSKPGSSGDSDSKWKGTPIYRLRTAPSCYSGQKPRQRFSDVVLFSIPPDGWNNEHLLPHPKHGNHYMWDDEHVYMPCSDRNQFPSASGEELQSRWKQIKLALLTKIPGVLELEEAILSYNPHYRRKWNFKALHEYFLKEVTDKERHQFFEETLPRMQVLALRLPKLFTKAIPLLKQGIDKRISMSQEQASCILANAFFCTFPRRNYKVRGSGMPDINFSNLFSDSRANRKVEKLKCIFNYFERVTSKVPTGTLSFTRQCVNKFPDFHSSNVKFTDLHVASTGTIEDDGIGMLQADFANKYVGGGVLGHGLVQEEIRFMICPEMIVSRLFTEVLRDSEVLIMTGCERFSTYTGYAESFQYDGNYVDDTERDPWGRMYTEVVAMDALVIRHYKSQFGKDSVMREINKAYVAFKGCDYSSNLPAVCTGNWGCGAFGGDKELKALIQMIAAAAAGRQVCYFTFGDEDICARIAKIHGFFMEDKVSIRSALGLIKDYQGKVLNYYNPEPPSLFEFLASNLGYQLVERKPRRQLSNNSQSSDNGSIDYKASTP